jgi:hypothetical protein
MSGPRYSIFPADCLSDRRVKDIHLRVLASIGTHTDNKGWCEVNQRKLGEACGKSRETINRAIRDLCDMGYLSKREQKTRAGGRTISQYRVLMDRPDEAQDAVPHVTPSSQPPVTPEDHNPCDVATSQLNDPFFNDHLSLRSDSARDRFARIKAVFPLRPRQNLHRAEKQFLALASADQVDCETGAGRYAGIFESDRQAKGESLDKALGFVPSLANWIAERGWAGLLTGQAGPEVVLLTPSQPEFELVRRHLGNRLVIGKTGNITVKVSDLEEARRIAA